MPASVWRCKMPGRCIVMTFSRSGSLSQYDCRALQIHLHTMCFGGSYTINLPSISHKVHARGASHAVSHMMVLVRLLRFTMQSTVMCPTWTALPAFTHTAHTQPQDKSYLMSPSAPWEHLLQQSKGRIGDLRFMHNRQ